MAKIVYIYALVDPRNGDIRYVGKTIFPERRLTCHINEKKSNRSKISWIAELRQEQLLPEMRILETCAETNWEDREKHWIKHGHEVGWKLLNKTEGGYGPYEWTPPKLFIDGLETELLQKYSSLELKKKQEMVVTAAEACADFYLDMVIKYVRGDYKGAYESQTNRNSTALQSIREQLAQTI